MIIELLPKPCLLQSYQPVCIFNGGPVRGVYLNDSHILCAAPGARKAGSVEFILQLYVNSSLLYTAESSFLYSMFMKLYVLWEANYIYPHTD